MASGSSRRAWSRDAGGCGWIDIAGRDLGGRRGSASPLSSVCEERAMRLGLNLGYSGSSMGLDLSLVLEADRLGYHSVWSAEAYGSDAVTPIAWVAARTERIRVGTAI